MTTTRRPSPTALRDVERPADVPADAVGRLVDAETGETLVNLTDEDALTDRAYLMRWRASRRRRTGQSVRPERFL